MVSQIYLEIYFLWIFVFFLYSWLFFKYMDTCFTNWIICRITHSSIFNYLLGDNRCTLLIRSLVNILSNVMLLVWPLNSKLLFGRCYSLIQGIFILTHCVSLFKVVLCVSRKHCQYYIAFYMSLKDQNLSFSNCQKALSEFSLNREQLLPLHTRLTNIRSYHETVTVVLYQAFKLP